MARTKKSADIYDAYEQVDLEDEEAWEEYEAVKPLDELISEDPVEVNKHLVGSAPGQGALGFKSVAKPYCGGHDGDEEFFSIEYEDEDGSTFTKTISGASGSHLNPAHTELVVDCAGLYSSGTSSAPFVEGDDKFDSLKQHVVPRIKLAL